MKPTALALFLCLAAPLSAQDRALVMPRTSHAQPIPTIATGSALMPSSGQLEIADPSLGSNTNLQITYDLIPATPCYSFVTPHVFMCLPVAPLAVVVIDPGRHVALITGHPGATLHWLAVTP